MTGANELQNLILKMIQLQSSRSASRREKAEDGRNFTKISDEHEAEQHTLIVDTSVEAKPNSKNGQKRKSQIDVSSGTTVDDIKAEVGTNIRATRIAQDNQSNITEKARRTWEDASLRRMAELDAEQQKQAITNQQKYGRLVMLVFISWLFFVGAIIAFQAYILYQTGKVFSSWALSVLIASPSGILVIVFRILFPPREPHRKLRKNRKRK